MYSGIVCFLVLSLCLSCDRVGAYGTAGEDVQGETDVTGKSGSSSRYSPNKYRLACTHVKSSLEDILFYYEEMTEVFQGFKHRYQTDDSRYIHIKAQPTHKGSMCPMNISCCTSHMEKEAVTLSRNEFKAYYDNIINDHSVSCPTPGKRLFKSSRIIMDIIMKNLEIRVNESLEGYLPENTFANLTRYLSSFSAIADTCPIQQLLKDQLESLVTITLGQMFEDNDEFAAMLSDSVTMECMTNTTLELVKDFYMDILAPMQRQLHDLGQFVRALKVAGHALNVIRHHALSESCVTGIIRMQYCAICGGYGRFSPCLYLCLNTLRGCFADLAEIHGPFKRFIELLHTLSSGLIEDFKPDNFVDKYLKQFVRMVNYLKENQDAVEEKLTQECNIKDYDAPDDEVTESRRRRSIFQPVQESTHAKKIDPLVEQLDFKDMRTVMKAELECLERLGKMMVEVPQYICHQGNHKISQEGNTQCWTGKTLGEYQLPLAGLLKRDQLYNQEYSNLAVDTEVLYSAVIFDINAVSDTLGQTVAFRERCQDSDDEDCALVLFNQCFEEPSAMGSGSGSGSGSGFGSGSGSGSGNMNGMEDYEIPTIFYKSEGTQETHVTQESTTSTTMRTERMKTDAPTTDPFTMGTIIIESGSKTTTSPSEGTTQGTTNGPTKETTTRSLTFNNRLDVFPPPFEVEGSRGVADLSRERHILQMVTQAQQTTTSTTTTKQKETTQTTTMPTTSAATATTKTVTTLKFSKPTEKINKTKTVETDTRDKDISNKLPDKGKDPVLNDKKEADSDVAKSNTFKGSPPVDPGSKNKDDAGVISSSAPLHLVQYVPTTLTVLITAITVL